MNIIQSILPSLKRLYLVLSLCSFTANIFCIPNIGMFCLISQSSPFFFEFIEGTSGLFPSLRLLALNINFLILIINIILLSFDRNTIRKILKEKSILIFTVVVASSVLISFHPLWSLYNILIFISCTSSGIILGTQFQFKEQIDCIFLSLLLMICLSLFYIVAFPEIGITHNAIHPGAWKGIFVHKNLLGWIAQLSVGVSLAKLTNNSKYRPLTLISCFLSFLLMIGSQSRTALVSFLIVCSITSLLVLFRRIWSSNKLAFWLCLFLIIISFFTIIYKIDLLFSLLNRDLSFTGRMPLWESILEKIRLRPYLGYGYRGFWFTPSHEYLDIWDDHPWKPPSTHNIFLETWLELGTVGLVIFLFTLTKTIFYSIKISIINQQTKFVFYFSYCLFLISTGFTESIFYTHQILWLIYVSIIMSVSKKSPVEQRSFRSTPC